MSSNDSPNNGATKLETEQKSGSDFDERSEPEITVSALMRAEAEPLEDEAVLQGEDMGKYLLVGELATGGMAELFLAVHQGPEGFLKVVVVKRVLPHLTSSTDFVQMFADEARIAARLEHPNIVRTYEFGATGGDYFTVMEYLAGEDLSSVLRRLGVSSQVLPTPVAASIAREMCKGLHFAHELTDMAGRPLGLVHRDINPSNVIVTYTGEVKIIDFGVAKANTNLSKTVAGTIKGKLSYMAPEQILARGIDRRADVFSTGIVLWELITGKALFGRDNEAATMYAIMNDPIPPPSRMRSDIPEELDAIVIKALSRTPADRYETLEEMQNALEAFLATRPMIESRYLPATMESLFGSTRANAKRAIARTQHLQRNISLVMRLRTDVRNDLAAKLEHGVAEAAGVPSEGATVNLLPALPEPKPRSGLLAIGAVVALAIVGGLGYVALHGGDDKPTANKPQVSATLKVESKPAGAAVFLNGEPTGFMTPATLTDVASGSSTIRLEMPGYAPLEIKLAAKPNETLSKVFDLQRLDGRLLIGGLPVGASVVIGDTEYAAGEAISLPIGSHEVRIVVDGQSIVQQRIDVGTGDQMWAQTGDKLVRK